jgi:hypothetical protein
VVLKSLRGSIEMMLHPRHEKRVLASVEISKAILEIEKKYELTWGELLVIVSDILNKWSHQIREQENKTLKAIK